MSRQDVTYAELVDLLHELRDDELDAVAHYDEQLLWVIGGGLRDEAD